MQALRATMFHKVNKQVKITLQKNIQLVSALQQKVPQCESKRVQITGENAPEILFQRRIPSFLIKQGLLLKLGCITFCGNTNLMEISKLKGKICFNYKFCILSSLFQLVCLQRIITKQIIKRKNWHRSM